MKSQHTRADILDYRYMSETSTRLIILLKVGVGCTYVFHDDRLLTVPILDGSEGDVQQIFHFQWTSTHGTQNFVILWAATKASSYIAQYPVFRTVQSALHFTSLTDLFTQTPSRLLWEASSHRLQLMCKGYSYTYPPLSIARYAFIQLSELEQRRVKTLAQGFNTAAQDSNPGSHSREAESLPLSALHLFNLPHVRHN